VIALLGEPKDKTILKGGAKVYGYFYGESGLLPENWTIHCEKILLR